MSTPVTLDQIIAISAIAVSGSITIGGSLLGISYRFLSARLAGHSKRLEAVEGATARIEITVAETSVNTRMLAELQKAQNGRLGEAEDKITALQVGAAQWDGVRERMLDLLNRIEHERQRGRAVE